SQVALSRSRPRHKNDNCHVEQKNWTLVRRLIGYQRLDTPTQLEWLDALYGDLLRPFNNCFQPVMKLVGKQTCGPRVRRLYDRPTTPLRRVLDSGRADPDKIQALVLLYTTTSPLTLKRRIDHQLAAMPAALEVNQSA
ncbi:MAG: DDE-type integrase/transposase/recombinase, partial [Candidatus Dormibacteria bacterium]